MTRPSHPRAQPVTARDVADHANVSVMMVSRVVNGEPHVRPTTKARVEKAIRMLGYEPDASASAREAPRFLPKVAFLFDTPNATILAEMLERGFGEASAAGVQLVFVKMRAEDNPAPTLASILGSGIEGVILSPPLCDDARLRILLVEAGLRVVAIGCCDEDPTLSTIGIDDSSAAFELTRYLIQLGHRRIGFIRGHPRHRSSMRRRAGYAAALLAHGITPDPALEWEGGYNFASAIGAAEQALSMDPPITALLASDDDMAAALISVARARGVDVPRSLSVCGFDDSEIALTMFPQLTTVSQPIAEMVRWGVRQIGKELHALWNGAEPVVRKESLAHALVFRASDAPPEDKASRRASPHPGGGETARA